MAIKLTVRQSEILEWIREFITDSGMPPTRAEICQALGFRSPNAAQDHLKALARKGAIELLPDSSRGIRLLDVSQRGLPVIGRVAAGTPILAEQHIEDYHQIESGLFRPHANYLLRVNGMSMRDVGILDGDLLAVHASREAVNGQIVVARIDDEVTVKRFRRRGNRVRLLAENSEFNSIEIDLRETPLVIEGLGVGILRNKIPL